LNLMLIPKYGILGAAYASLISQCAIALGVAYKFRIKTATLHLGVILPAISCMSAAAATVWFFDLSFGSMWGERILTLMINGAIFGAIFLAGIALVFRLNFKMILNPDK